MVQVLAPSLLAFSFEAMAVPRVSSTGALTRRGAGRGGGSSDPVPAVGRGGGRWADQADDSDAESEGQATSFGEGSVYSDDPLVQDRPTWQEEGVTYDILPGFGRKARERQRPALAAARAARGGGWIPQRDMPTVGGAVFVQGSWGKPKGRLAHKVHLDLRTGPGTFLALQECTMDLEWALCEPSVEGDPTSADPLLSKKQYEYWTLRCDTDPLSCVLAARKSHVSEAMLVRNTKRWDGRYRGSGGGRGRRNNGRGGGDPAERDCFTRYMVGRFKFHGDMLLCGKTTLTVMNVHLHIKTSKKAPGFGRSFDAIWPELAGIILTEGVDVVAGNWGASLFQVIPRFRELGVNLQLGAWFPWARHGGGEAQMLVDTCGVFFWGSHRAPQRLYQTLADCFKPPVGGVDAAQAAVAAGPESEVDEDEARDQVPNLASLGRLQHFFAGQGEPLKWFLPGPDLSSEDMMAFVERTSMEDKWGEEEDRFGTMPPSVQKAMKWTIWDSTGELFRKGSHMPLACYLGHKQSRRSEPRQQARDPRDEYYQTRAAHGRGGGGGGAWWAGRSGWNRQGGDRGGGGGGGWNQAGDRGGGGGSGWNQAGGRGGGGWDQAGGNQQGGGGAWNPPAGPNPPAGSAAAAGSSQDVRDANLWANWGGVNQPPVPPVPPVRPRRASGKGRGRGGGSRSQSRSSSVSSTGSWWGARQDLDRPVKRGSSMTVGEYLSDPFW